MCANLDNIQQEVANLEAAGANRLHIDVMDGNYVPNFALGLGDVKAICRNTTLTTEAHLMILEPGKYVRLFAEAGVDIIYFHPDSDRDPMAVINQVREAGKSPGIVINPETAISSLLEYYDLVDHILVMAVKPGRAGNIYLPHIDQKIRNILELKAKHNLEIIIDGACSLDRMKRWSVQGVDGFVLGTSALFGHKGSYKDIIEHIKQECGE